MKKNRLFSLILVLALTAVLYVPAMASTAGSAEDPLISESYIENTFSPGFLTEAKAAVRNRLDQVYEDYVAALTGGSVSTGSFAHQSVSTGGSISLTFGDSVVLLSGGAQLTILSGTVVNVTTGNAVSSGGQLVLNNRYMAVEDSTARVTATADCRFLCDGTVEVTQGTGSGATFTDLPTTHWAYTAVESLVAQGLINGRGDGTFAPNENMTRGDFVTLLGRLHGINPANYSGSAFGDVPAGAYYAPYVKWASQNRLVTGYDGDSFGPKDKITRAQMATLVMRYVDFAGMTLTDSGSTQTFADDGQIPAYAKASVYRARNAGLISGKGNNIFDPKGNATRVEVSALIYKLTQLG